MAKKEYEDEDIRLFEIYAKWTRNINYARAWAWMNDEAKERLIAKYPWTFPILAKPKSNVRRQVKIEGKTFWQRQYYIRVWIATLRNEILLPNFDKKNIDGLDTDHIVPISYGFKNNISPEFIGSLENLQLIPNQLNLNKGAKITPRALCLLKRWKKMDKS